MVNYIWNDENYVFQQKCISGYRHVLSRLNAKAIVCKIFGDYEGLIKVAKAIELADRCMRAEAYRLDPIGYESEYDLTGLDD